MTPRTTDKKNKRDQILRAALGVFAERGVHDFKMIDIARSLGMGKGTLYEYFPSKEAVITGSLELFSEDCGEGISTSA